MPITVYPRSRMSKAVTALSTPPLIATTTVLPSPIERADQVRREQGARGSRLYPEGVAGATGTGKQAWGKNGLGVHGHARGMGNAGCKPR